MATDAEHATDDTADLARDAGRSLTARGWSVAVAVTGVAGSDEQDGEPPGTVWIGVDDGTSTDASPFTAGGSPTDIGEAAVAEALRRVLVTVSDGGRR